MPFQTDDCSPLLSHCVLVMFRQLACDTELADPSPPALSGTLTMNTPDGAGCGIPDGNGGVLLAGAAIQQFTSDTPEQTSGSLTYRSTWETVVENGCTYWAIRTCALPANVDSDYDPTDPGSVNRAVDLAGTSYTVAVQVAGQRCEFSFVIDASVDYTPDEISGCIPVTVLSDNPGPALGSDSFTASVCSSLQGFPTSSDGLPAGVGLIGSDCRTYPSTVLEGTDSFVTFVDNGNGTATLTSADGATTLTVPTGTGGTADTFVTFVDNGNGTATLTSADGATTLTVPTGTTATTSVLTANGDGSFTHDDGNGTTVTIPAPPAETVTTFVDNGNGTYTYTNEAGAQTTTVAPGAETVTTLTDNGNGSFTYTNEAGAQVTIPAPPTETTSTLADNGNGSFTYTNEDGLITIIQVGSDSTLTDNGDGSFTHDPGDGTAPTTVSWCDLVGGLPALPAGVTAAATPVIGDDGSCYQLTDPCTVTGGNGLTGTPSGAFTDGCSIEPLGGLDPETAGFAAADFPEGWRQLFSGGVTGSETWIVLLDTNSVEQWHQIA